MLSRLSKYAFTHHVNALIKMHRNLFNSQENPLHTTSPPAETKVFEGSWVNLHKFISDDNESKNKKTSPAHGQLIALKGFSENNIVPQTSQKILRGTGQDNKNLNLLYTAIPAATSINDQSITTMSGDKLKNLLAPKSNNDISCIMSTYKNNFCKIESLHINTLSQTLIFITPLRHPDEAEKFIGTVCDKDIIKPADTERILGKYQAELNRRQHTVKKSQQTQNKLDINNRNPLSKPSWQEFCQNLFSLMHKKPKAHSDQDKLKAHSNPDLHERQPV